MIDFVTGVVVAIAGDVPQYGPWPFANAVLNTVQAIAIAWLVYDRRRD